MAKRSLSMLLAVLMVLSLALPTYAAEEEPAAEVSGETVEVPAEPAPDETPEEPEVPEEGDETPVPEESAPAEEPEESVETEPTQEPEQPTEAEPTEVPTEPVATEEPVQEPEVTEEPAEPSVEEPTEEPEEEPEAEPETALLGGSVDKDNGVSDALKAGSGKSGEVKLGANISDSFTVPEDVELTLDLNGHTLTTSGIIVQGTLSVTDNSTSANGTIAGTVTVNGANAVLTASVASTTITSLSVMNSKASSVTVGCKIGNNTNATSLSISGGKGNTISAKVTGNVTVSATAPELASATTTRSENADYNVILSGDVTGTVTVSNGAVKVTGNITNASGTALAVNGGDVDVVGDKEGNKITGAVTVGGTGDLNVGGTAYGGIAGAVTVSGGKFTNNKAISNDKGTALTVNGTTAVATLTTGTITGGVGQNAAGTATLQSAVVASAGTLNLVGGTIKNNTREDTNKTEAVPALLVSGGTVKVGGNTGTIEVANGDGTTAATVEPIKITSGEVEVTATSDLTLTTTKGNAAALNDIAVAGGTLTVKGVAQTGGAITGAQLSKNIKVSSGNVNVEAGGTIVGTVTAEGTGAVKVAGSTASGGPAKITAGTADTAAVALSKNATLTVGANGTVEGHANSTAADKGTVTVAGSARVLVNGKGAEIKKGGNSTLAVALTGGTLDVDDGVVGAVSADKDALVQVSGMSAEDQGKSPAPDKANGVIKALTITAANLEMDGGNVKALTVNDAKAAAKITEGVVGGAEEADKAITVTEGAVDIEGATVTNTGAANVIEVGGTENQVAKVDIGDGAKVQSASDTEAVISIGADGTVNVTGTGAVRGWGEAGAVTVTNGGALNVSGGVVSGREAATAGAGESEESGEGTTITVNGGEVNVSGGNVIGSGATDKYAIDVEGASGTTAPEIAVNISGGNVSNKGETVINIAQTSSGSIDNSKAELNITGGTVRSENAGVLALAAGATTISGGTVETVNGVDADGKTVAATEAIEIISVSSNGSVVVSDGAMIKADMKTTVAQNGNVTGINVSAVGTTEKPAVSVKGGTIEVLTKTGATPEAGFKKVAGIGMNVANAANVNISGGVVSGDLYGVRNAGALVVAGGTVKSLGQSVKTDDPSGADGVEKAGINTTSGTVEINGANAKVQGETGILVNAAGAGVLAVKAGEIGEGSYIGIHVNAAAGVSITGGEVMARATAPTVAEKGMGLEQVAGILSGVANSRVGGIVIDKTAKISGYNGIETVTGTLTVAADSDVEISGEQYGICVKGGTINLNGGVVGGDNSGLYMAGGVVTVNGDPIDDETEEVVGGIVVGELAGACVEGGTLNVTGGAVTGPAGIVARDKGTVSVTGGSVTATGTGTVNGVGEATNGGAKYDVPCAAIVNDKLGADKTYATVTVGDTGANGEPYPTVLAESGNVVAYTVYGKAAETVPTGTHKTTINKGVFNADVTDHLASSGVVACVGVVGADETRFYVDTAATSQAVIEQAAKVLDEGDTLVLGSLMANSKTTPYKVTLPAGKDVSVKNNTEKTYISVDGKLLEGTEAEGFMIHKGVRHPFAQLDEHPAILATCTQPGRQAYWQCSYETCQATFSDKGHTLASLDELAIGKLLHVPGDTWQSNGTHHWKTCNVCHTQVELAKHDGDTTYKSDEFEHYHECSVCGAKYDRANHTWGADNKCTVCGAQKAGTTTPSTPTAPPTSSPSDQPTMPPTTDQPTKAVVTATAKQVANGIQISWTKLDGADTYRVYYRIAGTSKWTAIGHNKNLTYTWKGYKATNPDGKTFEFAVRGCKLVSGKATLIADATYKASGKVQFVKTPTVTVKQAAKGITISWTKVAGADTYRVYYKTVGGAWKAIGHNANLTYTWKHGTVGTSYQFTVRPCTVKGTTKTVFGTGYNTSKTIKYAK